MTIRAQITGMDELRRRLRGLDAALQAPVRQAINASALAVERQAKIFVQRGQRTGRLYPRGRRWHRASAPGEPPKSDTGYLASHITTVLDLDGFAANVEAQAEYSRHLEFGTTKMAARPFLFPAFEMHRAAIRRYITDALVRVFRRAERGSPPAR